MNATGQKILTVDVHGFAGNAGEYNERIRREYESPFKPGGNPDRVLPTLVTGRATGDRLAPYSTTTAAPGAIVTEGAEGTVPCIELSCPRRIARYSPHYAHGDESMVGIGYRL